MKIILGLDLGTTSIGWALVKEAESPKEVSSIVKLGVRVNPLSTEEINDFEKGRPLSLNADRTLKRGARRNLQRFKLRRENLFEILKENKVLNNNSILCEEGNKTTFETIALRAKAAKEKISLAEFAKVLFHINKKRGYKSSRKAKNEEEGNLIDGMAVAKELYDKDLTPGEFVYALLLADRKYIPDFYRSDLQDELDRIWNFQKKYHPSILTDDFYTAIQGQGKIETRSRFLAIHGIYTAENKGKREEVKLQHYKWRTEALCNKLSDSELAYVITEINYNLNSSSGYLGAISDRSKELYFNKETIGVNLHNQLKGNSHTSLRNQVFYRQDYLDEFEVIWETQAKFHQELSAKLKKQVRDVIIFYQRKLKSQKHLIVDCEFEKHHKAVPKSSPLFQEAKIWQMINNLEYISKESNERMVPSQELKEELFEELNIQSSLKSNAILKLSGFDTKTWELNYKEGLDGNKTNASLYNIYQKILEDEGYGFDWNKKTAAEIKEEVSVIFKNIGIDPSILAFDSTVAGNKFDKQASYQFWHLLYSAEENSTVSEEDKLTYGDSNVSIKKTLQNKYGIIPKYGNLFANISLLQDHGRLSAKALRKIMPHLQDGHNYSEACALAKYNHSNYLNKEELENRVLKDKLELLKKNSLRNPVVEKILNQLVNLVNQVVETYGKPDEIRIELARELKKSAEERKKATQGISKAQRINEDVRKILLGSPFFIKNPSRKDIIRYKLYEELQTNGYRALYTDRYIPKEKLFSKEIDIDHIIPQSLLFDDSFSNKTIAYREINLEKSNATAMDYLSTKGAQKEEEYKARLKSLFDKKSISKGKYLKLLMTQADIPEGFIDRDLRDSQYIAKKAKEMLFELVRKVNTSTGKITNRLRNDWNLIHVLQELTLPKYKSTDESLVEKVEKKDGSFTWKIKDWTKRNDHRHHAMDALAVAFTTSSHVQYLNNLKGAEEETSTLYGIKNKITGMYDKGNTRKRQFNPPMPNFRAEAKRHLEEILVSFKAKNKVVTKNKNRTKQKGKGAFLEKIQLTPRGQLHKETIYAKINIPLVKEEKINARFDAEKIETVCKPKYKEALLKRLTDNGNDPKKAFAGKNKLATNPIFINLSRTEEVPETVKTKVLVDGFTIRKEVGPDLKVEKVVDDKIREILKARLVEHKNNPKEAFVDLENKPIWLNKEKGIQIKRVRIMGVSNAEALHSKKDHFGQELLDSKGQKQAVDYVSTGNNHHVAFYMDEKGDLHEKVVSFYEAVARVNAGLPIVNKEYKKENKWKFQFTLKKNEMFLFPSEDFDPKTLRFDHPINAKELSSHLFRVQKIASMNYMFRHHLETTVDRNIKGLSFYNYRSTSPLKKIVKVRLNHLGEIVHVGEYD